MKTSDMDMESRLAGAAIGQAIGDAWGYQVERSSPERCAAFAEGWLAGRGEEPMRSGYRVGQVSDDTQCALAAMRALADGPDLGRQAAELGMLDGCIVGGGTAIPAAASLFARLGVVDETGIAAFEAAREADPELRAAADRGTNGAAIRLWPLAGVVYASDRFVELSARLTHTHAEAVAGAISTVAVMRAVLYGAGPDDVLARALAVCPREAVEMGGLALAARIADMPEDEAREAVWTAGGSDPVWRTVSPKAGPTVAMALRAFVMGGGHFAETFRASIAVGGDVDSVAGLALAFLGGMKGPDVFPKDWVARLRDGDAVLAPVLLEAAGAVASRTETATPKMA